MKLEIVLNKEQMSLVFQISWFQFRYSRRFYFISFVLCENGLTGKNLASVLIKKIDSLGLEIENCRGQAYDGAGNVTWPKSGLAAETTRLNRKALYMHCFNHQLNLSVANIFKIKTVHNLMDRIKEITEFLNYSQTREQVLEKCVDLLQSKDFFASEATGCVSNALGISNYWPWNIFKILWGFS